MPRLDRILSVSEKEQRLTSLDPGRIYIGEVMDTRNVTRGGEIKVWILGSTIPKEDKDRWVTCSYASTLFGTTPHTPKSKIGWKDSPTSFGNWTPMPFVGNLVFLFYPYMVGQNVNPYWFACPVNSNLNSMLPGIPGGFYDNEHKATTEVNEKNDKADYLMRGTSLEKRESGRGDFKPLNDALAKQGLTNDKLRGFSTAGSKRESPSMCYGFLTPYGNSFTIDDGWSENDIQQTWNSENDNTSLKGFDGIPGYDREEIRNNAGFRFRTRNGTQVLISDEGTIYAINGDGSSWIELTNDGRIMGYAQKSADIGCEGDINLHSKQKIRMEAEEGFVFKTNKNVSFEVGGAYNISSPYINTDSVVSMRELKSELGTIDTFNSSMGSINGVFSGTLDGTAFYATDSGAIPVPQPIPSITPANPNEPNIEKTTSLETTIGVNVNTIVSELPSHEPYASHNKNDIIPDKDIKNVEVAESYSSTSPMVSNQIEEVCPVPPDTSKDTTIPQMQLSEHFTLADLCYSDTAVRNKVSNVPTDKEIAKLKLLAENVLEKIWTHYGQRVIINSGYRGPAVNRLVGGASSSQHCKGEAADIEISGLNNYELACWIRDNLDFDQLILEFATNLSPSNPNSGWVHVSLKSENGQCVSQRKQVLTINKYGTRSGLII